MIGSDSRPHLLLRSHHFILRCDYPTLLPTGAAMATLDALSPVSDVPIVKRIAGIPFQKNPEITWEQAISQKDASGNYVNKGCVASSYPCRISPQRALFLLLMIRRIFSAS